MKKGLYNFDIELEIKYTNKDKDDLFLSKYNNNVKNGYGVLVK